MTKTVAQDTNGEDLDAEHRSDVLYTDEMNRHFYKQKIAAEINRSFIESEAIQKESLVHPRDSSLKAKQVLSLVPCPELLGQTLFDVHLGNKLEKADEADLFIKEGILGKIDRNEFNEKTLKIFNGDSESGTRKQKDKTGTSPIGEEEETVEFKEELEKVGEYGVLRKKLGQSEERKMLLMVINHEESAEIKELDYSLFLRNKKKQHEPETLNLEEDLEEERRFKLEEQSEIRELDSFLMKRLSQLYPSSEGILWEKPHPPAKRHFQPKTRVREPKKSRQLPMQIEEESQEESPDSLFDD